MILQKIKSFIPSKKSAIAGAAGAALGAVGTFFIQDYTDFRNSRREVIKERISKSDDAQKELQSFLGKLAGRALNKGAVTSDDLNKFSESVRGAYSSAGYLVVSIPQLQPEFTAYGEALIGLQRAATEMKGATSGSDFVHYISEYDYTKNKFNQKAASYLSAWP